MHTSLEERIVARAHELGFDLVGIAPSVRLPHGDNYLAWLDAEYHGRMGYLARNQSLRVDPGALFEPTRAVISVAMLYGTPEDGYIARYARGGDYHDHMRALLKELGAFVQQEAGQDVEIRPCVDTAPLLERDVAILAGLGWLGKSTCVINQKLGSYMLLGELCVSLDLQTNDVLHPDRCGTCTRCIEACPTGAIVRPYVLDARRCISYLTIELKGPIPRSLRTAMGNHLFGCDICQSVCPWNRKAPTTSHDVFAPLPDVQGLSVIELLDIDADEFRRRFRRSPLWRPRRHGLLRNACVVIGNSGDQNALPALARALHDEHPLVRGHAAWAMGQLGGAEVPGALDARRSIEDDPWVLEELDAAAQANQHTAQ